MEGRWGDSRHYAVTLSEVDEKGVVQRGLTADAGRLGSGPGCPFIESFGYEKFRCKIVTEVEGRPPHVSTI